MVYADYAYYQEMGGIVLDESNAETELQRASTAIDTMTYYRINAIGYDNLTEFQKQALKEVCCGLADFNVENADLIDSPISGYNINGVSINFSNSGNASVSNCNGVLIPKVLERRLMSTGLMWGGV